MGVFVGGGGGGGGGLTWTLILRIFGMVSITFFFAPPSVGPMRKSCRKCGGWINITKEYKKIFPHLKGSLF